MRRRFAYLHIPKVAGSSVSSALAAAAPDARRAPYLLDRSLFGGFDRFDMVNPTNAASVWDPSCGGLELHDVAVGHFSLPSLLTGFELSDVAMMLREPRARLLSHYSFWRGWDSPTHDGWAPYVASRRAVELDWNGFLRDPSIAAQTDNVAVRMLLGAHPDIPLDNFIAASAIDGLAAEALERQLALGHVDAIEQPGCWDRLAQWLGASLDIERVNVTALASGPPIERTWFGEGSAHEALDDRTRGDRVLWSEVGGSVDAADVIWRGQIDKIVGPFEQLAVDETRAPGRSPVRRILDRIAGR